MSLWIVATLLAAAAQTTRFVLQKRLGQAGLSATGATFARFVYAAPLALIAALATRAVLDVPLPAMGLRFWGFVAAGGLAQIVATELTVRLFALRNFAVGVAFTKTEIVLVALFSALVLGEVPSGLGVAAIVVGFLGVVAMALWLGWRDRAAFARVLRGWRATAPVGITGMLGSLGWFTAFSLQSAAYVRALGQVELLFTLAASVLIFRERLRRREVFGITLIGVSVVLLVQAV